MKTAIAYVHPLLQILILLIALASLRLGLALKKQRTQQRYIANQHEVFIRHTQLGLLAIASLVGGYLLGLVSMPWLRNKSPFGSAHFFFATITLILFIGGGYMGWRLKKGTTRYADVRDLHGFLVYLALFISLGVGVMGFILLP